MKKKIGFACLLAACCMAQVACDDNKDEYLDDFKCILYLRNSGEQPLTIYKTGETTDYTVIVNKAGSDRSASTQVDIQVMDDATLAAYNAKHGKQYKAIPAAGYTFESKALTFGRRDYAKTLKLTMEPEAIASAMTTDGNWVIPVELINSRDSINSKKNVLFVKPTVLQPLVQFSRTGYQSTTFTDGGAAVAEFKYPVLLPIPNKWTFDCNIQIDQQLLDDYNTANGVFYELLPADVYTMNKPVQFTPEMAEPALVVKVDRTNLKYGNYVLPLRLSAVTHPTFGINTAMSTNLAGISYVPDDSKLTRVALTPEMITYYPEKLNEGSVAALLDGDPNTHYHSTYNPSTALPHWLKFALAKEATAFKFEYLTRAGNTNGAPKQISLYGSMDGTTFDKIAVINEGLPTGKGETYKSSIIVGKAFKYLRFDVDKSPSGSYFALAEFKLWVF